MTGTTATKDPWSLDYLPGKLPITTMPAELDLESIAKNAVRQLSQMQSDDFAEDCLWRDQLAMTGTLRTFYGSDRVCAVWAQLAKVQHPSNFTYEVGSASVVSMGAQNHWIDVRFTFETRGEFEKTNSGFLNLVPHVKEAGKWQIWGLQTLLEDIKGYEQVDLRLKYPISGKLSSDVPSANGKVHSNGASHIHPATGSPEATTRVEVVVIGAGQAGINSATWLKSAGISNIVLERYANVGDNWVKRYESLYLHTPHEFNTLCFGPTFNREEYSEWLTAAELARGYQAHVDRYQLDIWLSSNISICTFDEQKKEWTIDLQQHGITRKIIADHIILCTGAGGSTPLIPKWPGKDLYKGTAMHSVEWKSGKAWEGKKGIVVGSANTGHDLCENMLDAGLASVTMVQRGSTYVVKRDHMTMLLNAAWPTNRSQELSDRYFWSPPTNVARHMCNNFFQPMLEKDADHFNRLENVGFKVNRQGDFIEHLVVRFGGHFMDHGASDKISDGLIKVKSDSTVTSFTEKGLRFTDGSELEADVIVYGTGFEKDMASVNDALFGPKVSAQIGDFFGIDDEGEAKGAYKRVPYPNIFMVGGGCSHARYFPRLVALQIKADLLGKPLKTFTE